MKTTNLPTTLANHFQPLLMEKKKKPHITILQAHVSMRRIKMITDLGQRQVQVNQLLDLMKESDHISMLVYYHFLAVSDEILAKK